ncbi:tetratricopeptide repeat protein [Pendulispora albinea]|uniref:Serine/threonine-protein kinase n=1 Tax=Pendulispora albinea TaxID=2741071 RepID=A0ABZ2M2L1_9BACT
MFEKNLPTSLQAAIESHFAECSECDRAWGILVQDSTASDSLVPRLAPRGHAVEGPTLPVRASSQPELTPGTRVGRYLVISVIGTGGMGIVYRAIDPELNRAVALKLLRAERADEKRRDRLLREAQALALVDHPNVVNVFDVGQFLGQVFFAMELVEGTTLRAELRRAGSNRKHLLQLLDQAGRGLAAAHSAGLVHRDFKPENVLIAREQRAKVVDFGLARAVDTDSPEEPVTVSPVESMSVLERPITETGGFIGTPAYMAPEQHLGLRADARSDQFSFSIVAYEALLGRHPFVAKSGKLSLEALCAGKVEVRGRRLDQGYLRVLSRGLSRDPADRYPSLEHLLDELALVPRRRRRRVVAILAVVCAAAGLIGGPAIQEHRAQRCEAAATQALAGIWDMPRREKVENVFVDDGKAFGRDVWQRTAATLDAYADQWKRTSAEICRSAESWRAEDQATHTRASLCLDERRRELRAVTDVLAAGDRDVRLRAPDITIQLGSLSTCTNPAALALTPLPTYDRTTSITVEHIRDLLAQSQALDDARKTAPSQEAARQALELARKLPDRALAAEALYRLSIAQESAGEFDASEASIVQAVADAESSGHERLLPLVLTQLLSVVGNDQERPSEVERLVPFIEAAVERFDPQGPANIELLLVLGLIEDERGHYDRAIRHFNAALDMGRRVFRENDVRRIEINHHLANVERTINQLDKGIARAHSALAESEALFGNEHPKLMQTLSLLARMLSEQGDAAGAQAVGQRALHIVEQASSPENPDVAYSLSQLGMTYLEDGQPAVALPLFRRAYAMIRQNDANTATRLSGIARAEEALGHLETARTTFEETLALYRRLEGPGHPDTIKTGVRLGRLMRRMHLERDALQLCIQLLDAGERTLGPDSVAIALALSCVGEGYEQLGRLPEALKALERAEKLLEEQTTPPRAEYRAIISFALARVLWRTRGDGERARRLANEAVDHYQHAGRLYAENTVAVQTWLTKVSTQQR